MAHVYKISSLYFKNKKVYFQVLKVEKEKVQKQLEPKIKEKFEFYNSLNKEIRDYIQNNCKILYNNDNFMTKENAVLSKID